VTDILPTRRQVAIASVAETDSRLTLFNSSMTVSKWSGDRRGSRTPRPKRLMGVGWGFSGPLIIYLRESRFLGDSEPFAQNHLACASPGKGGGRVASLLSVASVGSHRGLPPCWRQTPRLACANNTRYLAAPCGPISPRRTCSWMHSGSSCANASRRLTQLTE